MFCHHFVIFGLIFVAGGIDYSQWREKAQNLFSDEKEPLSVTGTKTGIKSDETRTFWSTAPPKVDHDKAWGHKFSECLFYAHGGMLIYGCKPNNHST